MSSFAGTGALVRLAMRRDRIIVPSWISVFVMMVVSSAAATTGLYATEASRVAAVRALNAAPVLVALYGKVYASNLGALSLIKMGSTGAAMLAVLAFMLVVRHTRTEEEAGRLELLGSTAIGRSATLAAGLAIGMGTSLAIGVLSAFGLASSGLPVGGSFAFGLAWAATGCAFAAVGALTAQVATSGRAASGLAAVVLGLAYLARGVGDGSGTDSLAWLSWLSPIGWGQQVRPFAHERWPVLLLLLAFTAVVSGVAFRFAGRRDLGAGMLTDRHGDAHAARLLSSPTGLAWRLERATVMAWALAIALAGGIVGSIASQIGGMLDSPEAQAFIAKLGGTRVLTDAYLALELGMIGSIVAVFGMQAVMRLRAEEVGLRAEAVLATAIGRTRWVGSHVLVALAGTAGILVLGGIAVGVGHGLQVGDLGQVWRTGQGALVTIPAAWVMVGVVVAFFGLAPRFTSAAWGVFVGCILLGEFGSLFNAPKWVMDLSPFAHTPRFPGGQIDAGSLIGLLVAAAVLLAVGMVSFQRRDVA